jgi:hypothetical protein
MAGMIPLVTQLNTVHIALLTWMTTPFFKWTLWMREAGGKSNNMERIGFEKAMGVLLASPIVAKEVVTDGHLEIAALMSKCLN